MSTRCRCGNDDWREVYDYVPYGMTVAQMACGAVCECCGAEYDDAVEWCEECFGPLDECECERCDECHELLDDCNCEELEETSHNKFVPGVSG